MTEPWDICLMIVSEEFYLDETAMDGSPASLIQPYGYAVRDRIKAARQERAASARCDAESARAKLQEIVDLDAHGRYGRLAREALAALVPPPSEAERLLEDQNWKDAEEFCKEAFGHFIADVSQYTKIVAELLQHATDRALSPDPGTVAVASGPTAEDIRACAWSTLIGWQRELGDSIDFICDQIARKATLTISSTHHGSPE